MLVEYFIRKRSIPALLSSLSGSFVYDGIQYYAGCELICKHEGDSVAPVDAASHPGKITETSDAKRLVSGDIFCGKQYTYTASVFFH